MFSAAFSVSGLISLPCKRNTKIPYITFKQASVEWQKELYKKGWIAPNWPKEYGGTGWSITQKFIFSNEIAAAGAPDVQPFGVKMVGPVIYTFASDALKEQPSKWFYGNGMFNYELLKSKEIKELEVAFSFYSFLRPPLILLVFL